MPTVRIDALGTTIDLVGSAEAVESVSRDWSRCRVDGRGGAPPDATLEIGAGSSAWLASRVTKRALQALSGARVLLHAAAVSTQDGRTLVLVGRSGAGKTTACQQLCRTDFGYVTDETVSIDDDLRIVPYPKPLLLRRAEAIPKDVVGPDELEFRTCADQLVCTRMVLLRRDGTQQPRLEPLPLIPAMLALVGQTSGFARMPRPLTSLARVIGACGGAFALHYDEIAGAGATLISLMNDDVALQQTWEPVETDSAAAYPHRVGPVLKAAPVHEAVRVGDEVLLLRDGLPVWLRGIGSTIWLAAVGGVAESQVLEYVERRHGHHPDAARLVDSAVYNMLAQQLIVLE